MVGRAARLVCTGILLWNFQSASASISDCSGVYVGQIWIERTHGLFAVVLLNDPEDSSGSYWQYFTTWSADDRKSALATLTAAKLARHKVHIQTQQTGGCGITTGNWEIKSVTLVND